MATGYTYPLYEGKEISFTEFALSCAKAFFRDTSELPESLTPSDYHKDELAKAQQSLAEIEAWDETEATRQADEAYAEQHEYYVRSLIERNERHERYLQMLRQVNEWATPTHEHSGLKRFMIEQLESSIAHDCTDYPLTPPRRVEGPEYKLQQLEFIKREIDIHTREFAAEVERTESATQWIKTLRASLDATAQQ